MSIEFLGHFHPLLVHLPIGFLLFALLMEYVFHKRNSKPLMQVVLLLGAVSAILSALLGWLLSFSGDYDADLLYTHKWAGICLSVISLALWIWKQKVRIFSNDQIISHVLFGSMFFALIITGHYGGSLTHGEDYLSLNKKSKASEKNTTLLQIPITDTSKGTVYDKIITPILTVKCYNCHNASKKKGNFRMQTYEVLMKGGKTGQAFQPGDPAHSEIVKRILLDINDEKRMPPKGKKQLSNEEISLLYWWIQNGASRDITITEVKKNDTLLAFLSNATKNEGPKLDLPLIKKADSFYLSQLQKTQWEIHYISKESPYLDVSAISFPSLTNEELKKITSLTPNIAWLNLANTQITDQAMNMIGQCSNLVRLTLNHTSISSGSVVSLKKLTHLQYLNLIETKLDDEGLKLLCEMPALKKIYCWNSLVTKQAVEECRKKYPGIVIDYGDDGNTIKP